MRVQVRALPAAHTRRHTTCCGRAPYNTSTAPNARGMQCGAGARLTDESVRCVEMLSSLTSLSIDHSRVDFPEGLTSKVCVRASVRASVRACGRACVCVSLRCHRCLCCDPAGFCPVRTEICAPGTHPRQSSALHLQSLSCVCHPEVAVAVAVAGPAAPAQHATL